MQAGASRSTTACVAYLMHRHRWTLDHAWALVAARHKAASPNVGFQRQLIEYHTQLHGSNRGLTYRCARRRQPRDGLTRHAPLRPVHLACHRRRSGCRGAGKQVAVACEKGGGAPVS